MIDREKVIEAFDNAKELVFLDDEYTIGYNDGIEAGKSITLTLLKEQPEIIRCKDCKHGRQYEKKLVDCEYRELATEPEWFCADGKRRTDDV